METSGELDSFFELFTYHICYLGKIVNNHLDIDNKGAFLVPIILGSDKTIVSVATGQTNYWPVYISIGNICNNVWCAHHNGMLLLSILAIPKSEYSLSSYLSYLNIIYR